jgi:PST family polysaccharide transporter
VLRRAFGLFVFLVCSAIATQGTFFIGILAATPTVALFAGAERIARGATSLTGPLTQAVFARLSGSIPANPSRAVFDARRLFGLMLALGSVISIITYILAPAFVRVLLGASYSGAIAPLQIMALMPVLSAISNGLGLQWLAPLGHDRALGVILLASVPLIGALAWALVPAFGVTGMALAEVAMESFVAIAIFSVTAKMRLLPWQTLGLPGTETRTALRG